MKFVRRIALFSSTCAVVAGALPAGAQEAYNIANQACWLAVAREAQVRLGASRIEQSGLADMTPTPTGDSTFTGRGTADGRPFTYTCTYTAGNNWTSNVRVTAVPGGAPAPAPVVPQRPTAPQRPQPPVVQPAPPPRPTYPEVTPPRPSYPEVRPPRPSYPEVAPPRPSYPEVAPPRPGYPQVPPPRPDFPPPGMPGRPDNRPEWSEVPRWLVGRFEGYNPRADAEVRLHVRPDGSVTARVDGRRITGFVRDGVLSAGGVRYTIERTRNGFRTRQIGRPDNVVEYRAE